MLNCDPNFKIPLLTGEQLFDYLGGNIFFAYLQKKHIILIFWRYGWGSLWHTGCVLCTGINSRSSHDPFISSFMRVIFLKYYHLQYLSGSPTHLVLSWENEGPIPGESMVDCAKNVHWERKEVPKSLKSVSPQDLPDTSSYNPWGGHTPADAV